MATTASLTKSISLLGRDSKPPFLKQWNSLLSSFPLHRPMILSTSLSIRRSISIITCIKKTTKNDVVKGPKFQKDKEEKLEYEGLITESLPNGMFRVRLNNQDIVLGVISGKIRKSFIRILPGDKVKIEVSRYDSTRGRITYRLRTTAPEE